MKLLRREASKGEASEVYANVSEVPAPTTDWLAGDAITVILKARLSVRLIRNVAAVSQDFQASATQARPAVLRHLARAGRQTAEGIINLGIDDDYSLFRMR